LPDRNQRHFGRGEKSVDGDDQDDERDPESKFHLHAPCSGAGVGYHRKLNRLLKYFNILVAAGVVAVFIGVYWYAARPLAQVSGRIAAPVVAGASAARDGLGVPHIQAASIDDALFVQGYVTAQDRLWQMDLTRRVANGEVAEIFGPAGIENDQDARRLRVRRFCEQTVAGLPPADRAALAAYARGVNHFIDTHLGRLPVEFSLLQYQPRPWRIADSLAIGIQMFRVLTTSWRNDVRKGALLQTGDPAKIETLYPLRGAAEFSPGSNAWAVAGSRTASGRPILAGDMHLDASIPSIWYLAHLKAPGLNVTGMSLPGMPGIIAGHNERVAWSSTNLGFDVQDLFSLKIDERTGRYLYRGEVQQAARQLEVIRVRGAKPVEIVVWMTRLGPLFLSEGKDRFALRWTATEPGVFEFPIIDINRAHNWEEFRKALSRFPGPPQNFVYADVEGNIGYQAAGKLPIRKDRSGDVPLPGEFEWQGFLPFDELPRAWNPPAGLVVTANQNPFTPGYSRIVGGSFAPPYRAAQIRDLLIARKGWKAADMLTVQMDVYSAFSHFLARQVVAAVDRHKPANPRLQAAARLLRDWNGQMEYTMAAPFLVTLTFQHLRRAIGDIAAPTHGAAYQTAMSAAVLERLLRNRPPGWFANWDEALLRAFDDAVEEGSRIQGREPSRWQYGRYVQAWIRHPVGARAPWYITAPLKFWWVLTPWRSYENYTFDIGPVPMSGSATTVKVITERTMPSMRLAVDLGNLDGSLANIPAGQSGQILSPHYKDQWTSHYLGRSFPMQFGKPETRDVLEFAPSAR
jgi:penicillin amidase